MIHWCKLLLYFVFSILLCQTGNSHPVVSDSSAGGFQVYQKALLQGIEFEKNRIAHYYRIADSNFFELVDSVTQFALDQNVSGEQKNIYLTRLKIFLQNIYGYNASENFKSGNYAAILSYYPVMMDWEQKDELLRNLKRYSSFSIKAARLIPDENTAEEFLTDYANDYPDDIFRYVEEYSDRKFALSLLERAVRLAPESAKRYFSTNTTVNNFFGKSSNLYIRKSREIFVRFGAKSNAYLLLDDIINKEMSIEAADSICHNPDKLFHLLVQRSLKHESSLNYSVFRYLDHYCIEAMRRINENALNSGNSNEKFRKYSTDEMFILLTYGYREPTRETFSQLLEILQKKTAETPVSNVLVATLDKQKLKELIIYCDKNKMLKELLSIVDDERKEYLLSLTNLPKKEELFPMFKTFARGNAVVQHEKKVIEKHAPASTAPVSAVDEKREETASAVSEPLVEPIKIVLDEKEKITVTLKKNIVQSIQNIPSFINHDYAETVLSYAALKEPDELFKKTELFKSKRFSKNILEQCAINAPVSVKRYLYNPQHPVNYILQYSTNPAVKKIFEINTLIGYRSKPLLLLDGIMKGAITINDAIALDREPGKLYSELVKIISHPDYAGKYSIDNEMRDYSLRFIREINDKIAAGGSQPFYGAENLNAKELYFLMLYGKEEVFTSTFTGLFHLFMEKIPNHDGDAFLRSVSHNHFRDFLSLCSNFGTLEEFLTGFSRENKKGLLIAYTSNLEKEKDELTTIVLIAEAISNLTDNQLLSLLQANVRTEFDRVKSANDQIGLSIYGILSSMISGNAKVEANWYRRVSEQFKISSVNSLPSSSLFAEGKPCVEQMYFYNDDDGRSSFINFMNTFRNQPAWSIEDRKSYVRVYSNTGAQVEIFANKPETEQNGISSIEAYMKEENLSPSIIIHRGHSFHTESTLEKIPSSAKLIFVGSCGGFYKISMALENAPEAHIISTKQVGTKTINDAMLLALNDNIRTGKDIVWNDFWDKMREKLKSNPYFNDYIPPNKNLEALFFNAYYKILGV